MTIFTNVSCTFEAQGEAFAAAVNVGAVVILANGDMILEMNLPMDRPYQIYGTRDLEAKRWGGNITGWLVTLGSTRNGRSRGS